MCQLITLNCSRFSTESFVLLIKFIFLERLNVLIFIQLRFDWVFFVQFALQLMVFYAILSAIYNNVRLGFSLAVVIFHIFL